LSLASISLSAQTPCVWSTDQNGKIVETCGSVGIGTTAPDRDLQVINGATSGRGIEVATVPGPTRKEVLLSIDGNYGYLDSYNFAVPAPFPLKIQVNGGNTLLNPAAGNVGIGTSNPVGGKLHVFTTTSADGIAVDGTNSPAINFRNAGTVAGYLGLATLSSAFFTDASPNDLTIRSENNRVLIGRGSGASTLSVVGPNVGIGTNDPKTSLHLASGAASDVFVGMGVDPGPAGPAFNVGYAGATFGRSAGFFNVRPDASAVAPNPSLRFLTANAQRMIITNTGNVGIGTVLPGLNGMDNTLAVQGATTRGMLELVTGQGDGDAIGTGQVGFFANANTSGKQIAAVYALTSGTTAANRGGMLTFWTKPDAGALTERMRLDRDGVLSIGGTTLGTDASDKLIVNGAIRAVSVIGATYQDVAEWVPATESIAPGTVVIVDPNAVNGVAPSNRPYDTAVAGVISAQPGVLLGREGPDKVKVATTGRVKVHVDASRFPIHPGDLLVSGDRPGMAMRSEPVEVAGLKMHRPGTLIGKALEPLQSGEGEILVLLSLQ
jgi:hypothetical protein